MWGVPAPRAGAALAITLGLATALSPPATAAYANHPATGTVRLMAVGDMELAFGVGRRIVRDGPQVPFAAVDHYFAEADVVLGNLECSLSRNGTPWPRKLLHFGAPGAAAKALAVGGFDAVSVANNHSLDFGRQAFLDTLGLLDAQRVGHAGGGTDRAAAHAPLIIERNGLRLALLSYVTAFWGPVRFSTRAWEAGPIARVSPSLASPTSPPTSPPRAACPMLSSSACIATASCAVCPRAASGGWPTQQWRRARRW